MYNRQLETFITVADEGSFNKAAEKLYISNNAVMKQINLLEDRLGFPLFNRSHTGLTLTPAGKSIYHDSKFIISYCKEAVTRADSLNNHCIRIGKSFTTPVDFIFTLWQKISELEPNLKMEFKSFENTPENGIEIMNHFGTNIDLVAGVYSEHFLENRNSQAFKLYDTKLVIGVPYGHRLYHKDILTIDDLYDETIMMIRPDYMEHFDLVREELKKYPSITLEDFDFFSVEIFNQTVNSQKLMITVNEWKDIHPMMKMIPIHWDYSIPFGILYSKEPGKDVEGFIDTLKKIYQL